jgi:protein-disulfide isomerase
VLAALALPVGIAVAADAPAGTYHEFIEGDPKAKVTVIEYASLTCPHCAHYQETVYPVVKKNYIDTGKIRYAFRDFPLDQIAMSGALLARCAPDNRGWTLIDFLFKNQQEWITTDKPIEPLKKYAKLAGMTDAEVDACLKNQQLLKTITDERDKASTLYQVQSTPTFYVGDEKVEGDRGYDFIAKIIDQHLAKGK